MIEVGEYVRTIDGYIRKVIQVNKKGSYEGLCYGAYSVDEKYKNSVGISAKKIVKHSFNIKDLIEVKDIIKYRVKVSTTLETKGYIEGIVDIADNEHLKAIKEDKDYEVLQILTYEQFNQNVYIVKEEQ